MSYTCGEFYKPNNDLDSKAKQECFWHDSDAEGVKYGVRQVHRSDKTWLQLWCFDTSKQVHIVHASGTVAQVKSNIVLIYFIYLCFAKSMENEIRFVFKIKTESTKTKLAIDFVLGREWGGVGGERFRPPPAVPAAPSTFSSGSSKMRPCTSSCDFVAFQMCSSLSGYDHRPCHRNE